VTPPPGVTSLRGRANAVVALLITNMACTLVTIWATLSQLRLLQRARNGLPLSIEEAAASDRLTHTVDLMWTAISLSCVVAWLVWQHRAQRNLVRLGVRRLTFSPGWAVGWWFVPIANPWKPFQTVRELWRASRPDVDDAFWAGERTWSFIGWWWLVFLVAGVTARIAAALRQTQDIVRYIESDRFQLVRWGMWIVDGVHAIVIVRTITRRQEDKIALGVVPPPRPDTQRGWRP
jgi:hypothetical protein